MGVPDTNVGGAWVDIYISGVKVNVDPYVALPGGQQTASFEVIFDGPVHVVSANGENIFVSERQIFGDSFT